MAREAIIQEDTIIKGKIRNCGEVEIHGFVEGELAAETVHVHPGGSFFGTLTTGQVDVAGSVQGEVFVRELISIRSSGSVNGHVRYGQLAMEMGAELSADLRNVPPRLTGDFDVSVRRGKSVIVTSDDITAIDPDDTPDELIYIVSNANNGFVALTTEAGTPVSAFTQADIEAGRVLFVHDGTDSSAASFDVVVADHTGALSGPSQTVNVFVRPLDTV